VHAGKHHLDNDAAIDFIAVVEKVNKIRNGSLFR
jgi:hypothetical protein